MEPFKVKLDKERELKFTFKSFAALARECKINANDPATYKMPMDPATIAGFVWAGQLHTKDALTRSEVEDYIGVSFEESAELNAQIVLHVMDSRGVKPKKSGDS